MRILWPTMIVVFLVAGCGNYKYVPPSPAFSEKDLVGTWQANYGSTNIDTITLKADGTYQQIFQAPEISYNYESPWNKWHVEDSPFGKPKLYLEGMRYYASGIEIGESGGEFPKGYPVLFYDMDEDELIEMIDKVILAINSDKDSPRGIILWHMQIDPDEGPKYFVLIDD